MRVIEARILMIKIICMKFKNLVTDKLLQIKILKIILNFFRHSSHIQRATTVMQTSEEGVQQTELKSSPNNPFRNPQPPPQQHSIFPPQYHSASIESAPCKGENTECSTQWDQFKTWMIRWRGSRRLVLVIVAIALLLDNMLLTVVGEFFIFYDALKILF